VTKELSFAIEVCRIAGQHALDCWNRGLEVALKMDGTVVTQADRECEQLIRQLIEQEFPDDSIVGEETNDHSKVLRPTAKRTWLIDPIDGTGSYARGIPFFTTLLSLVVGEEPILGVMHAPALENTYWAETGCGAYKDHKRINVSDCAELSRAHFNFGELNCIANSPLWPGFCRLSEITARQRGYGDSLGFAFVFEGKSELILEPAAYPWDFAPMKILAQESGGRYSDTAGGTSIYAGGCFISNKQLHDAALSVLLPK
jgi:histidinol phosphatase-like enzyme (inositol monophosphatase family)